jgi:inward rectifier potassium channel
MFVLTWTAMHQLTDGSPFVEETADSLKAARALIVCTLTGFDSTIGQMIHARHIYNAGDIVFGARLVDILRPGAGNAPQTVDYNFFHDIELDGTA